jgi:hypothetical protein
MLVSRYINNVVATDRKMIAKVFHVLKWTSLELHSVLAHRVQLCFRSVARASQTLPFHVVR